MHVSGVVVSKEGRFELTLLITEGESTGQRVISSDDCHNLDRAAAVVLGLLIRQRQGLAANDSNRDTHNEPVTPTNQTAQDSAPAPPKTATKTPNPWRPFLRVPNLVADFWTLPKVNVGIGLAIGLYHAPWRWSLSGTLWQSQSKDSANSLSYRTRFRHQSIEAWTCRGWSSSNFEVTPCVLLALDHVSARASGNQLNSETQGALPISVGTGALGYWHLGHSASLVLGATGRVMTSRPEFVVEGLVGTERVYRLPLGTVVATAACEWVF
jgi:hypothetical protein